MEEKKHKWLKRFLLGFAILIVILIGIICYSRFVSTKGLIMKEYRLTNTNLSDNFYGLKIVHLSDIHYGTTVNIDDLKALVNMVNKAKPDIIVFTGDLFDKEYPPSSEMIEELTEQLSNMRANIGKYAVSGENDVKIDKFNIVISNSGFTLLNDNYELIYKDNNIPLLLTGVSSNLNGGNDMDTKLTSTVTYLNSLNEDTINPSYKILLIHEPDYIDSIDTSAFNLILAGHNHSGQIRLPMIGGLIKYDGSKKYKNDHYLINGTEFFISSGIGTTEIKYRLFNKPSFNLYRLTNK